MVQQAADKSAAVRVELLGKLEVLLRVNNFFKCSLLVSARERSAAAQQLIDNHSVGPIVSGAIVTLSQHNFRGYRSFMHETTCLCDRGTSTLTHIVGSAAEREGAVLQFVGFVHVGHRLGKSEVYNFYKSIRPCPPPSWPPMSLVHAIASDQHTYL